MKSDDPADSFHKPHVSYKSTDLEALEASYHKNGVHRDIRQHLESAIVELRELRGLYEQLAIDYIDTCEQFEKIEQWKERLGPPESWFPSLNEDLYGSGFESLLEEASALLKKAKEE